MKTTEFLKENSIIAQEADDMHKDHEVQMARSQMYSAAQSAIEIHRLLKNISELEGLDGWVASKLTLASEYLETVRDYLKYEAVSAEPEMMEFVSEAADHALDTLLDESKADPTGSWVVYDGSKVKRFKSRDGAKAYAEKNGGKVASSEHYADKIQGKQDVSEGEQRMSRAAKGHEKYGKEGMQALAKAGREGASEKELDAIRDKHDKYDESIDEAAKKGLYYYVNQRKKAGTSRDKDDPKAPSPQDWKNAAKTAKKESVSEMATGGASSAGGVAVSMGGPGHKPTTGVPKKVGNANKSKKVTVGKGIY